jgi:anti-anti-sigma regulatory factor
MSPLIDREEYSALCGCTYLNQASLGLIPRTSLEASTRFLTEVAQYGNLHLSDQAEAEILSTLRTAAAGLLGAPVTSVAVVGGASEGLGQLAGLLAAPDDEVILVPSDFPSVTYPWLAARQRCGMGIRWVPDDAATDLTLSLAEAISDRTTVVCTSAVQFTTGTRVDVAALVARARRAGARVVVDVTIQDRLFFANAHFFKRRLWAAVDGAPKPVRHVVLDASFISDIDASTEVALREVIDGLGERNIELHVARASAELRTRLDEVGLTDLIGADHFHSTAEAAVDACRLPPGTPARTRQASGTPIKFGDPSDPPLFDIACGAVERLEVPLAAGQALAAVAAVDQLAGAAARQGARNRPWRLSSSWSPRRHRRHPPGTTPPPTPPAPGPPAPRRRRCPRLRLVCPQGGRVGLHRPDVVGAGADDPAGGGRRPGVHRQLLAGLAQHRDFPRSPVAPVHRAQRADPERAQLRSHRRHHGRVDDLAAGNAGRGAQLGLRYTWIRDTGFTLRALYRLGYDCEALE